MTLPKRSWNEMRQNRDKHIAHVVKQTVKTDKREKRHLNNALRSKDLSMLCTIEYDPVDLDELDYP